MTAKECSASCTFDSCEQSGECQNHNGRRSSGPSQSAAVAADVLGELILSTAIHGNYASAHEGSSVIREEFEELWEHVRANTGYSLEAYHEAKQLASTAMKYMQMVRLRNPEAFT